MVLSKIFPYHVGKHKFENVNYNVTDILTCTTFGLGESSVTLNSSIHILLIYSSIWWSIIKDFYFFIEVLDSISCYRDMFIASVLLDRTKKSLHNRAGYA